MQSNEFFSGFMYDFSAIRRVFFNTKARGHEVTKEKVEHREAGSLFFKTGLQD